MCIHLSTLSWLKLDPPRHWPTFGNCWLERALTELKAGQLNEVLAIEVGLHEEGDEPVKGQAEQAHQPVQFGPVGVCVAGKADEDAHEFVLEVVGRVHDHWHEQQQQEHGAPLEPVGLGCDELSCAHSAGVADVDVAVHDYEEGQGDAKGEGQDPPSCILEKLVVEPVRHFIS